MPWASFSSKSPENIVRAPGDIKSFGETQIKKNKLFLTFNATHFPTSLAGVQVPVKAAACVNFNQKD